MANFVYVVEKTLSKTVVVEAKNQYEANAAVSCSLDNGTIVLTENNATTSFDMTNVTDIQKMFLGEALNTIEPDIRVNKDLSIEKIKE